MEPVTQRIDFGTVVVAEYEVIDRFMGTVAAGEAHHRFLFGKEAVRDGLRFAAVRRPSVSEAQCGVGMQQMGKEPPDGGRPESPVHEPRRESVFAGGDVVAVGDEESFAVEQGFEGFVVDMDSALRLEIAVGPHVVVAGEEVDFHPPSVSSDRVPSSRVKPFGTTRRYSYQKSNKSPTRKMASASAATLRSHPMSSFSRSRDSCAGSSPRCMSDAK